MYVHQTNIDEDDIFICKQSRVVLVLYKNMSAFQARLHITCGNNTKEELVTGHEDDSYVKMKMGMHEFVRDVMILSSVSSSRFTT